MTFRAFDPNKPYVPKKKKMILGVGSITPCYEQIPQFIAKKEPKEI